MKKPHMYKEGGRYSCEGDMQGTFLDMECRTVIGYGDSFRAAYCAWCAMVYGVVDESANRVRALGNGKGADPSIHS